MATKKTSNDSYVIIQKVVLISIISVTIIVLISIFLSFFINPKRQIENKITDLASNYYENIFYQNMLDAPNFSGDPEKALQRFTETGISPMSLRQLILINDIEDTDSATFLLNHCDGNSTLVKFFPEAPYDRNSYRIDIVYSCNF